MKVLNYLDIRVLKVFILLGIIGLNSFMIYGQDSLKNATVSLTFLEENESKIIKAVALDESNLPIEELDLYFYVERTFSLLPIGDVFNTTDENGEVLIEFPSDLPGDTEGNVEIVVKIIESDIYNDLAIEVTKNWGIRTQLDQSEEKRSLWAAAANAPISLVLIVSSMILVIWYIICYIVFKLFRISKIKPIKS